MQRVSRISCLESIAKVSSSERRIDNRIQHDWKCDDSKFESYISLAEFMSQMRYLGLLFAFKCHR